MNSDYSITNKGYDKKIHGTHKADNSVKDKRKKKDEQKDTDINRDKSYEEKKIPKNKTDNTKGTSVDFRA